MKQAESNVCADQKNSLHQLLGNLLPELQQVAVKQKSFFVNEIPENIVVRADKSILLTALAKLLRIVSGNADNSCIRVSAKVYHDVVLVHLKDDNTCNNYTLGSSLNQVQNLVGEIGGYIDITSKRQKETTIAFSFSNLPHLAA